MVSLGQGIALTTFLVIMSNTLNVLETWLGSCYSGDGCLKDYVTCQSCAGSFAVDKVCFDIMELVWTLVGSLAEPLSERGPCYFGLCGRKMEPGLPNGGKKKMNRDRKCVEEMEKELHDWMSYPVKEDKSKGKRLKKTVWKTFKLWKLPDGHNDQKYHREMRMKEVIDACEKTMDSRIKNGEGSADVLIRLQKEKDAEFEESSTSSKKRNREGSSKFVYGNESIVCSGKKNCFNLQISSTEVNRSDGGRKKLDSLVMESGEITNNVEIRDKENEKRGDFNGAAKEKSEVRANTGSLLPLKPSANDQGTEDGNVEFELEIGDEDARLTGTFEKTGGGSSPSFPPLAETQSERRFLHGQYIEVCRNFGINSLVTLHGRLYHVVIGRQSYLLTQGELTCYLDIPPVTDISHRLMFAQDDPRVIALPP